MAHDPDDTPTAAPDAAAAAPHVAELRRGTVVLACLSLLEAPAYGYALLETLDTLGVHVDANTLYPLLRRLESQGLLSSEWNTDDARPRKFYRCSDLGRQVLGELRREWSALTSVLEDVRRTRP
jgi:DNA-binding PadR family transcriptional regulator